MKAILAVCALLLSSSEVWAAEPKPNFDRKQTEALVEVVVLTDRETWISVNDVEQPKRLEPLVLKLPPGEYVVSGKRTGFKDVVTVVKLVAGMSSLRIAVICTERQRGP